MEYTNLGKSDLKVSRLGFGCCPMGGYGWGSVSEGEFKEAVSVALDNGINLFDTADIYGFGRSEELLGKFLKKRRKEAVIATKFGVCQDKNGNIFYDSSPEWMNQALNASLKRLDVEYIDLYHVHYLDGKTSLAETVAALEAKRIEGKIRYYGFSNISLVDLVGINMLSGAVTFQEEYSLARREKEQEIELIGAAKGLVFISWGSLGQGVLTGKYGVETTFGSEDRRSRAVYVNFHGEKLKKNVSMIARIQDRFQVKGRTLPQIAVRWILDRFVNSIVLVGIKRPSQLFDNVGALEWKMSCEDMAFLDGISKDI